MQIALVTDRTTDLDLRGTDVRGQDIVVAGTARHLADHGHDVTVYRRRELPGADVVSSTEDGIRIVQLDVGPARQVADEQLTGLIGGLGAALDRALAQHPPDLVHTHGWLAGAMLLTTTRTTPWAHTFHGLGVVERRQQSANGAASFARIQTEAEIRRRADLLVASSLDEQLALRELGAGRADTTVIPGGVDTTLFTPRGTSAPRSGRTRLLTIGPLHAGKGVDDLIVALRCVPDAELLVVGAPPGPAANGRQEMARLHSVVRRHGLRERVRFIGPRPHAELPWLLRSADLLVNVPTYGSRGLAVLEAMACGVVVVGTPVGGMLESITHGRTGLHVPPHSPHEITEAVRHLLDDSRQRRRMGAEGAFAVRERYEGRRVTHLLEAAYANLLGSGDHATLTGSGQHATIAS